MSKKICYNPFYYVEGKFIFSFHFHQGLGFGHVFFFFPGRKSRRWNFFCPNPKSCLSLKKQWKGCKLCFYIWLKYCCFAPQFFGVFHLHNNNRTFVNSWVTLPTLSEARKETWKEKLPGKESLIVRLFLPSFLFKFYDLYSDRDGCFCPTTTKKSNKRKCEENLFHSALHKNTAFFMFLH